MESILECSLEAAWSAVCGSDLLCEVTRPLVTFAPVDAAQLPARWSEGDVVPVKLRLFGILPIGVRKLHFERIDAAAAEIQTRESDALIKRWDHLISLRPIDDNRTAYADDVEIHAGPLTPIAWLFAQALYRHRRTRWRAVARRLGKENARADNVLS